MLSESTWTLQDDCLCGIIDQIDERRMIALKRMNQLLPCQQPKRKENENP